MTQVAAVSASDTHGCLLRGGVAHCWPEDDAIGEATPPPVTFSAVSAGTGVTCGVAASEGSVVCWGNPGSPLRWAPQGVFTEVALGASEACALRDTGAAVCWPGYPTGLAAAPEVLFTSITEGYRLACGLTDQGAARCWGDFVLAPW